MEPDPDWYLDNVLASAEPGSAEPISSDPVHVWREWWSQQWRLAGDQPARAAARKQGFAITTGQLRPYGLAKHDLRREVRRGCWSMPARGVASPVVIPPTDDPFVTRRRRHALASTAAALVRHGQVISGSSAAILHGLPTMDVPSLPQLTAAPPTTMGLRSSAHVFSATLRLDDVTTWFGAPMTTAARTVVDQARHDRRNGLIAADAALRAGLAGPNDLARSLGAATGWPGVRQAREIVAFASPQPESALESLVRLALHEAGFPRPELQVEVRDPRSGITYRVDFLLRRQRLIIEADGRGKYSNDQLWKEKRRQARLRALTGCNVESVIWSDVLRDWPETAERLWLACA